jgi:hypothetical protein
MTSTQYAGILGTTVLQSDIPFNVECLETVISSLLEQDRAKRFGLDILQPIRFTNPEEQFINATHLFPKPDSLPLGRRIEKDEL